MRWGRAYFAVQAIAGAAWWIAVFTAPGVREATLGSLDPVPIAAFDIPLFVICSAVAAGGIRSAAIVATGWTTLVAVALAGYATITTDAGWGVLVMGAASAGSVIALCLIVRGRVPTEWIVRGPFAFRPAIMRSNPSAFLIATLGQIVFFWGLFLAVIPGVIVVLEGRWDVAIEFPPLAGSAGVALLAFASVLGIASAVVMSTLGDGTPLPSAMPNTLVVAGPYRWVRNPMAVAGIAQGVAVGLILSSWLVIAYAIAGSLLWNYAVRPLEEADLEQRFGDQFQHYRHTVSCWIPRVPKVAPVGGRMGAR